MVLTFSFTSLPSSPEEIKEHLVEITSERLEEMEGASFKKIFLDRYLYQEIDIGSDKTVFLLGTAESNEKIYRWVSIFDKEKQGIIDKIVGRPGFFEFKSLTSFEVMYKDSLSFEKIEVIDLDNDGVQEIHIKFKSTWADGTSVGPILYSKDMYGAWEVVSLPSISETNNTSPSKRNMRGRKPYLFFDMAKNDGKETKAIEKIKKFSIYEDVWSANHNGEVLTFTTLRNGGDYFFQQHPVKGHSQIQTLAFFHDGGAALGPHFAVVNMFRYEKNKLKVDDLWNWGEPIYTARPLRLLGIEIDSIGKAGIKAHISGDVFYGYIGYEKIRLSTWLTINPGGPEPTPLK